MRFNRRNFVITHHNRPGEIVSRIGQTIFSGDWGRILGGFIRLSAVVLGRHSGIPGTVCIRLLKTKAAEVPV